METYWTGPEVVEGEGNLLDRRLSHHGLHHQQHHHNPPKLVITNTTTFLKVTIIIFSKGEGNLLDRRLSQNSQTQQHSGQQSTLVTPEEEEEVKIGIVRAR